MTLPELRAQVATAHSTYQAARYREALGLLPPLLAAVDSARDEATAQDRREVMLTYVYAYVTAQS